MYCHRVVIDLEKKDDIFHLRPISDVHVGSPAFNQEKFEKTIDFIASNPNYLTIGMGDYIDNVMAFRNGMIDKRWNAHAQNRNQLTTLEQVVYFTQQWKKVASKSLGMLSGNHEWATIDQQQFMLYFCNPLDWEVVNKDGGLQHLEPIIRNGNAKPEVLYSQKYLGRLAYVNLGFNYKGKRLRDYLLLVMHGGYAGAKAGGAVNRLKDITGDFDCDVVLMGHNHDCWTRPITRMGYDLKHNLPIKKKIILGNTGTFLESYGKEMDGYVEINPKEVKQVGTITVTFEPEKGDMHSHS